MDRDFPASHSMDSSWFAVDQDGQIAYFDTGENGLLPENSFVASSPDAHEDERALPELEGVLYRMRHPGENPGEEWCLSLSEAARLGLFGYDADGLIPGPYHRVARPREPLHVDQLPPHLRDTLKEFTLPAVQFGKAETLYPMDHDECGGWEPGYLCSDGKTVRPLSGRAEEYASWCRELREFAPESMEQLYFEGYDDAPPPEQKPKRRGRKGKEV